MEREQLESMIIEYLDGTLSQPDREKVEYLIKTNPEASVLFHQTKEVLQAMERSSQLEPSNEAKAKFEKEIERMLNKKEAKVISLSQSMVYKVAAGIALVMVSGALFYWINRSLEQERNLEALKEEMRQQKEQMLSFMGNENSAGQRIQGVSVAYTIAKVDDEIVNALVKTLNEDPNTNVRLAALDALNRFHNQPHVKIALVAALSKQTDAVVQIELIRILVEIKAKQSVEELKKITTDDNVLPAVKDEAYSGIMKLS